MHLRIYVIRIIMLLGRIVPNRISFQECLFQALQNRYWSDNTKRQYKAGFS